MPISSGLYDTSTLTYDTASRSYDGYDAPLTNLPAVGVFIAWTDTPYTVSPAWTEISQYVRQISIRRGRQDDLQQFGPGTASLVLDNRDRLFDPFNSSGANYANLKPRKQIKIMANWAGVEYPLYRGFVSGWPVEYTEAGLDSTVTIDCFDLMALVATEQVPSDWVRYHTLSLNPRHYYQMNDGRGASYLRDQNASNAPNLNFPEPTSKWTESETMGRGNLSSSLTFLRGVGASANSTAYNPSLSMAMWYKPVFDSSGFGSDIRWQLGQCSFLFATSSTTCRVRVNNGSNERAYSFSLNVNSSSHLVFVLTPNAGGIPTVEIYINGQVVSTTIFSTTVAGLSPLEYVAVYSAQLQELAVFDYALTADQIATLYNFNASSLVETTSARMQRILNTTSIGGGMVSLASSPVNNVCDFPPAVNAATAFQTVTRSENGELLVSAAGILTFLSQRYWSENARSNTSQATFTDSGVGLGYDASGIAYKIDADGIRNYVTVAFSAGGEVFASDPTSIATNGASSESTATNLDTADSAQRLANYVVAIYKNPKMQIEPFMSKGQANPSYNWPRLLALELLDRVTFKRTPSVGSAIQKDLLVQSIEHRITPGEWQTVVNGSTRYTGWFIIGVSLIGSSEDVLL
jgi:hypothetical protein